MPIQYAPIYEALAAQATAYRLPPNWSWLPVDPDCYLLGEPHSALGHLQQQFSAEDLAASGVAQRAEGNLAVNPMLTAVEPGIILLRNFKGAAFDILTATGCVSGAPPVLKALHDRGVQRGLQASRECSLYGTFSLLDTVLLRSLGVAAIPAARLETLGFAQLRRLLVLVDGFAQGDIAKADVPLSTDEPEDRRTSHVGRPSQEPGKFSLLLLAQTLATLSAEIPAGLQAVARHLADAERCLQFFWHGIRVWYPSQAELSTLRYRWRLRSADALGSFLRHPRGGHPLATFERPGPPVVTAPSAGDTYFALLQAERAGQGLGTGWAGGSHDPRASQSPYEAFVDQYFVRPLVERALESADPEVRALYMQMAALTRLQQRVMPAIFEMQGRSAKEIHEKEGQFLPTEAFRQLDQLGGRLQKLILEHKGTQRRRRRRR